VLFLFLLSYNDIDMKFPS